MDKHNKADIQKLKADIKRRALQNFMNVRGLNANEWAKRSGIVEGTIRSFLEGNTQSMRQDTWEALADSEHTTVDYILSGEEKMRLKKIPIAGCVPGGNPCEMINSAMEEFVYFSTESNKAIAVKIVGDSMNGANLPNGCYAIVDCERTDVQKLNNKIVVIMRGDESTCKRLKLNPTRFCPESSNPIHEDYFPKDGEEWTICGEVIGSYIKF